MKKLFKKRLYLTQLIFSSIAITLLILSVTTIFIELRSYSIATETGLTLLKTELTNSMKLHLKYRINSVVDFMNEERISTTQITINDTKSDAEAAYRKLREIYKQEKTMRIKDKIIKEFEKDLMENWKLNILLLYGNSHSMHIWNNLGIFKRGMIYSLSKKLIKIGYIYYNAKNSKYILFVKMFKPLNIYIIAWKKLNISMIKRNTITLLKHLPYENNKSNYIFVVALKNINERECFAKILVNLNAPNLVGKCFSLNMRGVKGFPFIKAGLKKIREKGSAFISYYYKIPGTNRTGVKIIYMELYKPYNWIVGSGFYLKGVDSFVNNVGSEFSRSTKDFLINFTIPVFMMFIFLTGVYMFITKKMRKAGKTLYNEIKNAIKRKTLLSEDIIKHNILFKTYEFKTLLQMANSVIKSFRKTEIDIVESFVSTLEARDLYTKGHSQRVAHYAKAISKALGFFEDKQSRIYIAGILHDIGKIGIPDHILLKPGILTKHEHEIMKYHPLFSYYILKSLEPFKDIAMMIKQHHERCGGNGYPDGLKCEEIVKEARILAIADIFDALTSKRPYRKRLSVNEAIEILKKEDVDKKILPQAIEALKGAFIKENGVQTSFAPEELETIRKNIFNIDYLTGLPKRAILKSVAKEFVQSNTPFVVCMIDIKSLMIINRKFSFSAGDELISCTAEVLKTTMESQMGISWEAISRPFSDSFVFIYKLHNIEDLKVINEMKQKSLVHLKRMVKNLLQQRHPEFVNSKREHISEFVEFAITYATYPQDGEDLDDLILLCELRKYETKFKI